MYDVKITLDLTYDKNYQIEADNEKQAKALSRSIVDDTDCPPNVEGWEPSYCECSVAYVEESAHNEELTDGEVLDLVYDWVKKWDGNTNGKSKALLELKQILKEHEE